MRIALWTPFVPRLAGRHGGARVTAQLAVALAERHDVALLALAAPGEDRPEPQLVEACERLEIVERRPAAGVAARLRPKLALLRGVPVWASEVAEPRFAARAAELARGWRPDVVQIEYPVMGQYLPALAGCPAGRVLVEHDASLRDLRRWRRPLAPVLGRLDARAWRRFERGVVAAVDRAVVFTGRDREALESLATGTPIREIAFGVALPAEPLDPVGDGERVLFVGNFAHPPNVEAAFWLAREILPIVRAARPAATLTLVGAAPPRELREIAGGPVELAGEVADVEPYLDRAAVVVAPLRSGGGMRVKVLEALAAGKALVATPLAVEGLAVEDGAQLAVAETGRAFAAAVAGLLADPRARLELGGRARKWAVANLSWAACAARFEELYAELRAADGTSRERGS